MQFGTVLLQVTFKKTQQVALSVKTLFAFFWKKTELWNAVAAHTGQSEDT